MTQVHYYIGPKRLRLSRDLATLTFDLETGMRVASKVGNLTSKLGHDRHLGSRIIRYVRDGRTDEQRTDKCNDYNQQLFIMPPSLRAGS